VQERHSQLIQTSRFSGVVQADDDYFVFLAVVGEGPENLRKQPARGKTFCKVVRAATITYANVALTVSPPRHHRVVAHGRVKIKSIEAERPAALPSKQ
jgi:hypothetical protein